MSSRFAYTARTADGTLVRGSMESADKNTALAFLRTRSLFITSLEDQTGIRAAVRRFSAGPLRRSDRVAFFRALAALVRAGVPLRRSLQVTIEQSKNARLREALRSILHAIENGLPLSRALGLHPAEFSAMQIVMVRAGEVGGSLDVVLSRLAEALEREQAAYKRIAVALTYPAFVASAAVALMLLLLNWVLPVFGSLYDQMKVAKPPVMMAALEISGFIHSWPFALAAAATVALLCAGVLHARGKDPGRFISLALRIPAVGSLVRKVHLARIARMLGTLLRSGVEIVAAIGVAADAAGARIYSDSFVAIRQALNSGLPLSGPMKESSLYDPLFVQMVSVGEETGTLDEMLLRVADYYDLDVETAVDSLTALVEPALLLTIGVLVAGLAATVFIPLYSLIGSIR